MSFQDVTFPAVRIISTANFKLNGLMFNQIRDLFPNLESSAPALIDLSDKDNKGVPKRLRTVRIRSGSIPVESLTSQIQPYLHQKHLEDLNLHINLPVQTRITPGTVENTFSLSSANLRSLPFYICPPGATSNTWFVFETSSMPGDSHVSQ